MLLALTLSLTLLCPFSVSPALLPTVLQDGDRVARAKAALVEVLVEGGSTPERNARIAGFAPPAFFAELRRILVVQRGLVKGFDNAQKTGEADPDQGEASEESVLEARKALTAFLLADAAGSAKARERFVACGAAARSLTRAVGDNLDNVRIQQLIAAVTHANASGARYLGQHRNLDVFGDDVVDLLLRIASDESTRGRPAYLIALRDFKAEMLASPGRPRQLMRIAGDDLEADDVRRAAISVLAYLGQREFLDKEIASIRKKIAGDDPQGSIVHLNNIVDLQSIAELNVEAITTYEQILAVLEKLPGRSADVGFASYNLACALEKVANRVAALEALDRALERVGERLAQATLWDDRELEAMRGDPRFGELCKKHGIEVPTAGPAGHDARKK